MLCSQALPSTPGASWARGKVRAALHREQFSSSFPAYQSSQWQHKGVPSNLGLVAASHPLGRAGSHSSAKLAEGREGEGRWWGGRKGRARSSCPTKAESHRKSGPRSEWICSASAKGSPRDLAVSPGDCSDGAVDIQGSAGAGLSPTAHSCLTIVESSNCREEFFLVDLYDFLWRAMVLWALCFFTHLF